MLALFATALVSAAAQGAYTVSSVANGYNLTNAAITVSGSSSASTIKILHTDGTDLSPAASQSVSSAGTIYLGKLDAGVVYLIVDGSATTNSYVNGIFVSSTNALIEVFHSYASGTTENHSNMGWATGMGPNSTAGGYYVINGTSQLNNNNATHLEAEKYLRVDTKINYSSFAEQDDLTSFDSDGSIAGIVAVSNGSETTWRALTGASTWTTLSGATPTLNADLILRAEFDFASASDRVRYKVSSDGTTFTTLKNGGAEWLSMAGSSNKLSSVMMTGSGGKIASVYGNIADTNMVAVGSTKYATIDNVPPASKENITLRTNTEWTKTSGGPYKITTSNFILSVPTIGTDGVAVYRSGSTVCITTGQYQVTNVTQNQSWTWLTNAVRKASGGDLIRAAMDVKFDESWQTSANSAKVVLDLNGYMLYSSAGTKIQNGVGTLVISNGYLSLKQTPGTNVKVASGQTSAIRFNDGGGELQPVAKHKFVPLLVNETHRGVTMIQRVMPVTDSTNLKACLVDASGHKGYVAISNAWLTANGVIDTVNANGENGIPKWQSYVLGLDPSKKGDQPYLVPVQVTTEGHMNVDVGGTRPSNSATGIKYVAVECDSTGADISGSSATIAPGTETEETLNSSGVKYYRLKLELTPDPLSTGE